MQLGVLLALAIVLVAPAAAAAEGESEKETVELAYRVPDGCPDEQAFVSSVTARVARAKFVSRAPDARRFLVDVRRVGSSYVGRLTVEHGAERTMREVKSPRCEAVVDAFVLFTALAIDPGTTSSAPPERAPPAASTPTVRPPPPTPPPRRTDQAPAPARTARERPPVWQWSAGSGGLVATGIADSAMVAAHPVVDLAWSGTRLSPSVRLGFAFANGSSQPTDRGGLTLGLRALVLSGCVLHLRLGELPAAVRLCGVLEGGVLEVRPFAIENPTAPNRPWFAAGPLLRLDVPLPRVPLAIGCDAALVLPFERERVFVQDRPTAALVEAVGMRFTAVFLVRGL